MPVMSTPSDVIKNDIRSSDRIVIQVPVLRGMQYRFGLQFRCDSDNTVSIDLDQIIMLSIGNLLH